MWRTSTPGLDAAVWGTHRNSFKREAEERLKTLQGLSAWAHVCSRTVALATKKSE